MHHRKIYIEIDPVKGITSRSIQSREIPRTLNRFEISRRRNRLNKNPRFSMFLRSTMDSLLCSRNVCTFPLIDEFSRVCLFAQKPSVRKMRCTSRNSRAKRRFDLSSIRKINKNAGFSEIHKTIKNTLLPSLIDWCVTSSFGEWVSVRRNLVIIFELLRVILYFNMRISFHQKFYAEMVTNVHSGERNNDIGSHLARRFGISCHKYSEIRYTVARQSDVHNICIFVILQFRLYLSLRYGDEQAICHSSSYRIYSINFRKLMSNSKYTRIHTRTRLKTVLTEITKWEEIYTYMYIRFPARYVFRERNFVRLDRSFR